MDELRHLWTNIKRRTVYREPASLIHQRLMSVHLVLQGYVLAPFPEENANVLLFSVGWPTSGSCYNTWSVPLNFRTPLASWCCPTFSSPPKPFSLPGQSPRVHPLRRGNRSEKGRASPLPVCSQMWYHGEPQTHHGNDNEEQSNTTELSWTEHVPIQEGCKRLRKRETREEFVSVSPALSEGHKATWASFSLFLINTHLALSVLNAFLLLSSFPSSSLYELASARTTPQKLSFLDNLASLLINPAAKIGYFLLWPSWQHWALLIKFLLEMLAPGYRNAIYPGFPSTPLTTPHSSLTVLLLSFICFLSLPKMLVSLRL